MPLEDILLDFTMESTVFNRAINIVLIDPGHFIAFFTICIKFISLPPDLFFGIISLTNL